MQKISTFNLSKFFLCTKETKELKRLNKLIFGHLKSHTEIHSAIRDTKSLFYKRGL